MLPVILTHLVKSSHSESHSGVVKLPSKGFLREIFQKSWFYGYFCLPGPRGLPGSRPRAPGLGAARAASGWGQAQLGWARLGSGFRLLLGFRFRLRISGFRLDLA